MAPEKEVRGTAAPRCGSQRTPEGVSVVERDVWRKSGAACSERTTSDIVGIEAFVDRIRESTGRVKNSGVIEGEGRVGTAAP